MPMSQHHDNICQRCRAIEFEKVLHLSAADLQRAFFAGIHIADLDMNHYSPSDSECALCRLFFGAIPPGHTKCTTGELRAYSFLRLSEDMHRPEGVIPTALQRKDQPLLAVHCRCSRWTSGMSNAEGVPKLICYPKRRNPMQSATYHEVPALVDFGVLRKWLQQCESTGTHWKACTYNGPKPRGMKLIDCETLAIESASPSDVYAAVSYVWGRPRPESENPVVKENDATLLLADKLPKVIQDAIEVTKGLGLRFLWCDKYCINQDNADEKDFQINQMDVIYKNAKLCIIAATGGDEHQPLPGVGTSPRKQKTSVNIRRLKIFQVPPHPRHDIEASIWSTRGWTYQEAYLSQRRLVFTENQVYFECKSGHAYESFTTAFQPEHLEYGLFSAKSRQQQPYIEGAGLTAGPWAIVFEQFRPEPDSLEVYLEHVTRYTKRRLTYEQDSIRAFLGIIRDFVRNTSLRHFCGVPYVSATKSTWAAQLEIGLLWRHIAAVAGNVAQAVHRREQFPSWSWAGWSGQVYYLGLDNMREFKSHIGPIHVEYETGPMLLFRAATGNVDEYPEALLFDAWVVDWESITVELDQRSSVHTVLLDGLHTYCDLSEDPQRKGGLKTLLESGRWELAVFGSTRPTNRGIRTVLLVIEMRDGSASRVGLASIFEAFENLQQKVVLKKRELRLV